MMMTTMLMTMIMTSRLYHVLEWTLTWLQEPRFPVLPLSFLQPDGTVVQPDVTWQHAWQTLQQQHAMQQQQQQQQHALQLHALQQYAWQQQQQQQVWQQQVLQQQVWQQQALQQQLDISPKGTGKGRGKYGREMTPREVKRADRMHKR